MEVKELKGLKKMLEDGYKYLNDAEKICKQLINLIEMRKSIEEAYIRELDRAIAISKSDEKLDVAVKLNPEYVQEILDLSGSLASLILEYGKIYESLGLIKKKK